MNDVSTIVLSDGTKVEVLWTETHNFLCKDGGGNYFFMEVLSRVRQCAEAIIPTKSGQSIVKFEHDGTIVSDPHAGPCPLPEDFVAYVKAHAERIHAA